MEVSTVLIECILLAFLFISERLSEPTCEEVSLSGYQIITKCNTTDIVPNAKCQFTLQNRGINEKNITDETSYITYNYTDSDTEGNTFNSTSCTLQFPVNGLKPGNWTVQVNMYPENIDSPSQETVVDAANALQLSLPTANIAPNTCPKGLTEEGDTDVRDGYIRQGKRASCLCTRAHVGNPPGAVTWTGKGGSFLILSQTASDQSTIQVNSQGTYTCVSQSVLNGSHSTMYTPKYAYGPSSVSLTLQPSGPIYLCPNQQTNIDITCEVPANNSNPPPLFSIRETNNANIVVKRAGDNAWSKSVKYGFTKPGPYTFMCRVENTIFSDIFAEAPSKTIQVYAPPNNPPSIHVKGRSVKTDDSEIWVKQGSDISVSCSVGETDPPVKSVNITCGKQASSSGPLSMSGVDVDELTCQCSVDHKTNGPCNGHNLNTNITIQTAYGPKEITMRITPKTPLNMCSSKGLVLTVICAVKQSDVRPGLAFGDFTLTKPNRFITKQTYVTSRGGEEYKLVNKLEVTTGGNDTFVCDARNKKFQDMKQSKSMTVEIREPPRDPPMMSAQSSNYGDILMEGDDVTVTCNVSGGYPSVQSVTLTCGQDQSVTSESTSAELTLKEIGLSYNETNCTCQATHVTGCYDLLSILPLTVVISNATQTEMKDSPPIGAVVGGAVGAVVVIAVVVVGVIICIRRGSKWKEKHSTDKIVHVDNSDLYYSSRAFNPMDDPDTVFIDNSELYGSAQKGYNPQHNATTGNNPQQDKMSTFKDNSALGLYGTGSQGYDPHQDPTAVFTDNSELYGAASQGYNPHQDPTAVIVDNSELYGTLSQEPPLYSTVEDDDPQPTMASATTHPEKLNPGVNLYDEIEPEELKKKQKELATKPKAQPTTGARPKLPSVPKPTLKFKAKRKSSKNDAKDNVTSGAPGGPPLQSPNVYEEVEVKDQDNESIYSLASNPCLLDYVHMKGLGGPSKHSDSNYTEVDLSDPMKEETG